MKITEFTQKEVIKKSKAEVEEMIKVQRKKDEKMVKGMFEFTEAGGGEFAFSYRFFPGDPIRTVTIKHAETCELPMGLIRHINNTKKKVKRFQNVDITNGKIPSYYEVESRIKFTPTDYL